jgi:twitching motility protein PilT
MTLNEILVLAAKKSASDIHLKVGIVPVIRKHGILRPLAADLTPLTAEDLENMAQLLMTPDKRRQFEDKKEADLSYEMGGLGRFRVNIFLQLGSLRMVIRHIPHRIPTIEELNLPDILSKIADYERGLVLVTGVTGSGKSSTLAAIINQINQTKNNHILTIEDPIEFLIRDRRSIISQRELGPDTLSFANALRAALRQDPDVILIGEMRDRETAEIALLAAETGHLVFSTLHTSDSQESINRVVSLFDGQQQQQVRLQLASVLKAIISQRLAPRKDQKGSIPAVEILFNNTRVRDLIADPTKTSQLVAVMEEGQVAWGMQSFDQSLMDLVRKGLVDYEDALKLSSHAEDFQLRYSGVSSADSQKWSARPGSDPEIELAAPKKKRASGDD